MTGQDIIDQLNEMVDEKVGGTYPTETEVLHWASKAEKTLARELLSYKLEYEDSTTSGTALYDNQDDFIEIERIMLLTGTGGDMDEVLEKTTLEELIAEDSDLAETGEPTHWYKYGMGRYGVWPVPDDTYYLNIQYAALPSDITSVDASPTLPEVTHAAINLYCGYRFWLKEEEPGMAQYYLTEFWNEVESIKGRENPDGGVTHVKNVRGYV